MGPIIALKIARQYLELFQQLGTETRRNAWIQSRQDSKSRGIDDLHSFGISSSFVFELNILRLGVFCSVSVSYRDSVIHAEAELSVLRNIHSILFLSRCSRGSFPCETRSPKLSWTKATSDFTPNHFVLPPIQTVLRKSERSV